VHRYRIAPPSVSTRSPFRGLLAALALSSPLAAQQPQRDTVSLPELVVTAERTPTPVSKSIATTTVIRGEELRQRGIYFVEDALKQVPGAMAVPTGSYGGISSLFLRGGESDYVKVLIDGVAVNQPGGAYNFGTLSTDNIDRIEIVRGPVSVLYGSDAVTGVIQIFTRRGAPGLSANAASQAGTYGTWSGQIGASGARGPVSFSGGFSRYTTDGMYAFNSGYASTVGSGAVTVRPDDRSDITLTARRDDNTLHFPTDFTGAVVDSNQRSSQRATTLGLDLGRRVSDRAELRLHFDSRREVDGSQDLPDSPGDSLGFYSKNSGRTLRRSIDARGILAFGPRVRVNAGAEAVFEALAEGGTGGTFDTTRNNYGVYSQGIIDLGRRTLVNLGLRLEQNEKFGAHLTFRAGAVYALTAGLRARGSVGTSFKEPSLRENFAQTLFERGNPDLDPEQSRSWEVGLEQSFLDGDAALAANYFDQRFKDLIQYDALAQPGDPTYQNVARATSRGVEVIGHLRPLRQLTLAAAYTYLFTRVDDAGFNTASGDVFVEGKPLVRRPKHSARVDARGRVADRVSLGAGVNYVGRRDDVDFRPFPSIRTTLPAYVTVDADASVDLLRQGPGRPGVAATFRAENLFDESYDTVVGFAGRGRAFFAGARVGF
jgi:vitamin B12 transporter